MSGPQGSSTPAFVESSPSSQGKANGTQGGGGGGSGAGGTQSGKGKGKGPAPRTVPASFGKTKGSIWCVRFVGKEGVGPQTTGLAF